MRRIVLAAILLCWPFTANAALTLKEVRTASNTVIEVYFTSTTINANEVDTSNPSQWTVNGQAATAINKYVMQASACDHHIFLTVPALASGTKYEIRTPHGNATLDFDDHKTLTTSIKINQAAYSALAKNNYALFAIWLGDGGSKQISGALPTYEVFEQLTGKVVATGTLTEVGADASSGDFVYRISLASVPEGGPYRISVKGYGSSYPFGVGGDFSRRLAYIIMRGQYYQRCGCPIYEPYGWDIRQKPCHTVVYDVSGPIGEANIDVTGTEPTLTVIGGYHDAGDTDRRQYHISNPVINLMVYEAFPEMFTDGQYDIPDKFDNQYNILGKGNGIPDIIDEAEWGTLVWEYLQKTDGSIYFGTETRGYADGAPYDTADRHRYGTVRTDDRGAAVAPGLFLHLARLLKPHNAARAAKLAERAQLTFNYIRGRTWANPEKLYYYVQKYLWDGDEAAHAQVRTLANAVDNFRSNVIVTPGYSLNNSGFDNPGYIISYMVEKTRPTDAAVITRFTNAIKAAADAAISELEGRAYPIGNNPSGGGWGHNVRQPVYATAPILHWRFSKDQKYFDAAASLLNYILGLNPIGVSYVTGLGFHRAQNPHDRQSWYTKRQAKWGAPVPGITVFGPGVSPGGTTFPAIGTLPKERQWCDNQGAISLNEFTIFETMTHYALYTVLSGGGKWDPSKDPFTLGPGPIGGTGGSSGSGGATGRGGSGGSTTSGSGGASGSGGVIGAGGSIGAGGGPRPDAAVGAGGTTSSAGASGMGGIAGVGGALAAGGVTGAGGATAGEGGGGGGSGGGSEARDAGATDSRGLSPSGGTLGAGGRIDDVSAGGAGGAMISGSTSRAVVAGGERNGCDCSMSNDRAWPLSALVLVALLAIRRRARARPGRAEK